MKSKFSIRIIWHYFCPLILSVLLLLSVLPGMTMAFFVMLILALLMIKKPMSLFPVYFVSSLSSNYFSPVEGLGAGRVLSILMIVSLTIAINENENRNNLRNLGMCFILIAYNLFSTIISLSGSPFAFFVMLQNLLIIFLLNRLKNVDIGELSTMLFWTSFFVMIGLAMIVADSGIDFYTENRLEIESTNENNFAMMCAQLGAVLFVFYFIKSSILYKLLSISAGMICLAVIFLTGSRAALVGLIAAILFLFFFSPQKIGVGKRIIMVLFFVLPIYLFYNFAADADLYLLKRFTLDSIVGSEGSGRKGIMLKIVTDVIPNYFFFGVGIGGENIIPAGIPKPCHNIIIDPLSQIGIIGMLLYWGFLLSILYRSFKTMKYEMLLFLPLSLFITGFFNGIGETIFYTKFFWNSIALCILYLNNSEKKVLIDG